MTIGQPLRDQKAVRPKEVQQTIIKNFEEAG